MNRMFEFYLNTKIKFGCGVRKFIPEALSSEKWSRVGLVVDHSLVKLPIVNELIDQLNESIELLLVRNCSISEPTYNALEEMRLEICDPSLQAVIGLGGGSAMDMAKAMAVLVHNEKPAIEYRGFDMMTKPVLPIIAIPTTAGTGSEVTPNASFVDAKKKKKLGINGDAVRPRYAFLDPELTLSCPKAPTISAAVDSIVHAVEAYVAKKSNLLARFFAREGFQRVFRALPSLIDDLNNTNLRQEIMYGAFLSGVALMHSGTGPAAAMSYPLGVHYNVPHGIGGGIFLLHVIEYNIIHGCTDYVEFSDKTTGDTNSDANRFLEKLFEIWDHLEIPKNLSFYGFQKSDKEAFIKETLELKGALDQNPVHFGANEIKKIIEKLA
ncbi:iron-containing alcohol dehydrogenase family protein [Thermodesulfobacteriota bacterium]